MRAVDTNVLARFLIDDPDDPEAKRQRGPATQVMSGPVFISITVLLEFEWVMRGFYRLSRAVVNRVLAALCGLSTATVEDRDAVLSALELHAEGVDFADALHLVRSEHCESLVTFDRALARQSARAGSTLKVERAR